MKVNFDMRCFLIALLAALCLTACGAKPGDLDNNQAKENVDKPQSWSSPPEMKIDPSKAYTAILETSKGQFKIEMFAKDAPITVNNFVFLAGKDFYNGVIFHRIYQSFMIQTGDPLGTGMGGPGYTIMDELPTRYTYDKGIVAMARSKAANSGGSQFFICTGDDCSSLNSKPDYTVFGRVISGMDTVDAIAATPVEPDPNNNGEPSHPTEKVYIRSITIVEK